MKLTDEITEVINSIRSLTEVGICFYDLSNFFHYDTLGNHNNRGHYCELCQNVRLLESGREWCNKSDRGEAVQLAKEYKKPFFFKCHMGMNELVLPLFYDEELAGLVFIGQCRIKGEDSSKYIAEKAAEYGGDSDYFTALYNSLPLLSRENLLDISKILESYFSAMIQTSSENSLTGIMLEGAEIPLSQKVCTYVSTRYMYPITPGSISKDMFLSQSYVSRRFHSETGETLSGYINRVRIENAKKLLTGSDVPVSSIAINVGFSDPNYFSRVFKKREGISPEKYRNERK